MTSTGEMFPAEYVVIFDGGSLGNPGRGYGSYLIQGPGGYTASERLEYGDDVTNNQAEYRTLIAALSRLKTDTAATGPASVQIRGDSQLVLFQLQGKWKVRNPGLAPYFLEARGLLQSFAAAELRWHPRSESVRVLGH